MVPGDPSLGPPLSFHEQDLLEQLRTALARALPVADGPYLLAATRLPEAQRAAHGGQDGPALHDSENIYALLHFEGIGRDGEPWSIDGAARICPRSEPDLARISAIVDALARVAHRLMRDAQDDRFGERPWLGLVHLQRALYTLSRTPPRKARTPDECEAILLGARELRDILAPPPEHLDPAVASLDAWLAAHTSLVKTPRFELQSVSEPSWSPTSRPSPHGVEITRAGLHVTLRMITHDDDGSIRDIKEQQLLFVPSADLPDLPRVLAFLDGWSAALPRAIARWGDKVDTRMPYDLIDFGVLDLKKPRTSADFEAAFARRWKLPEP